MEIEAGEIVVAVQRYTPYINSLCRRYFIAGGTAEDLYEEGVIGLIEACNNYNGESIDEPRFDSFVKLCIKRQIFDAIKRANTQKNKALNEAISLMFSDENGNEQTFLDMVCDRNTSNDPQELFLDKEKISELTKNCEKNLSPFEKQVLSHYLAGEKQSEISKNLNRDVKAIDNTIQRIKSKLK